MVGARVGAYTVLAPLEAPLGPLPGGVDTGAVYLAEHAVLGTRRAVLVLPPDRSRDPQRVHSFVAAARAAARLHAPHRIQVLDAGQLASGAWFAVVDALDGDAPDEPGPLALAGAGGRGSSGALPAGPGARYQLGDRLGGGGMAEVFAATMLGAEGFTRRVAIKRVLPELSRIPAFAAMFVAEAQIASRLAHVNIVSVFDFARDAEGRLSLVMEYVDGKDLASVLATGAIPPSLAIYVMVEMLRGLGYAHDLPASGVVHRDVSPQNLLLGYEGAVKLSDFGLAKVRAASGAVRSDVVRGKPSYMAPEQVAGDPLDGRADLFAAGVMLWEMLADRALFHGTPKEITAQLMFRDIARPSSVRAGVPADLEAVAMTLLAQDRGDRYPTAQAAIDALLACADAPLDGRGELAALLAARFSSGAGAGAGRRPRRASGAGGSRAGGGPLDGPITNLAPPSAVRVAERSRSAALPARRRVVPAALGMVAVVVLAAALGVAFGEGARSQVPAAVAGGPRGELAGAGVSGGVPSAPPIAVAPGGAGIDAALVATVGPRAAGRPEPGSVLATPAAPGASGAVRGHPGRARASAGRPGELAIIVRPWAMIWLNGKPRGQTPFRAAVPAGRYRVRLANDDAGRDETTTITVEPDRTATVERNW